MCKQNGPEAKLYTKAEEQEHQGDTGNDFRVQHWNIRDSHEDSTAGTFHGLHGDAGDRTYEGGDQRR